MSTKERLSLEAARMFSARGYHGTSIGDLAGALGIQKASVYSHISGKHDLLAEAALAGAVAFHAAQDAVPADTAPAERIRVALAAHLGVVSEQLDVAGVWLQEWRYLEGDARREFLRERHRYEERIRALFADASAERRAARRPRRRARRPDLPLARQLGLRVAHARARRRPRGRRARHAHAGRHAVSDTLLVERRGDVLELTLHRPEALNAFTVEMHEAMAEALREAADPAIRAVIVTGAGRAFCGGQDLEEATAPDSKGPGHRLGTYYNPNLLALRALDKPVIAAVNGAAAGAGMGLALACDVRLLAEGATFVPAFSAIGLAPDSGTSWFTVALLGYSRAFAWLTSGRRMGADEALELGLADEVVPVEELLDRARARADALAAVPGPLRWS